MSLSNFAIQVVATILLSSLAGAALVALSAVASQGVVA